MMNHLVCYNNNKQDITENIDSANKSVTQADNVCNRSRQIYSKLKSLLTPQEIETMEENLAANNTYLEHYLKTARRRKRPFFILTGIKKRLIDAMYKVKSIDEALSSRENSRATYRKDSVVNERMILMQEFNSLAENINNGVNKKIILL